MNVVIYRPGVTSPTDITELLNEEEEQVLDQQSERRAFQRVVDDVHFVVSNAGGEMAAIFSGVNPTTQYRVEVYDEGRPKFFGFVDNPSIEYGALNEWCEFDAFSLERRFWDKAGETKVHPHPRVQDLNITSATPTLILNREFELGGFFADGLFSSVNASEYNGRFIRGWNLAVIPQIGWLGMYRYLNRQMSLKELLEAYALYYNCEFYIDIESNTFVMRKREQPRSTTPIDIDNLIMDEEEPHVLPVDGTQVDYIYTHTDEAHVQPVFLGRTEIVPTPGVSTGMQAGVHRYIMTSTIEGQELFASASLEVILPPTQIPGNVWYVQLRLPPSFPNTQARKLYRIDVDQGMNTYRQCMTPFTNNVSVDVQDSLSTFWLVQLGPEMPGGMTPGAPVNAWARYDEEQAQWLPLLYDNQGGSNQPLGEIMDVRPRIQFHDVGGMTLPLRDWDPSEVHRHFMRDMTYAQIQAQYQDLFLTKTRILTLVRGTNLRLGDTIRTQRIPAAVKLGQGLTLNSTEFVVKRAASNLMKEHTSLEVTQ